MQSLSLCSSQARSSSCSSGNVWCLTLNGRVNLKSLFMIWQKCFGATDLDSETAFLYWDSCFQVWWSSRASSRWCTWRQWGKQGWSGCYMSTLWSTILLGLGEGFSAAPPDSVRAALSHAARVNRPVLKPRQEGSSLCIWEKWPWCWQGVSFSTGSSLKP